MVRSSFFVVLAMSSIACHPTSNVCAERTEPVAGGDGGSLRCARAEDCPRSASELFCTTDGLAESSCVGCDDTVCTRHVAEPCQ